MTTVKMRWLDNAEPPHGAPIFELGNNIWVDTRRLALAGKKAQAEGRAIECEDIDTRGTIEATCGDITCVDPEHLRLRFDDER